MYKLIRPFLFYLPPEIAHTVTLQLLKLATYLQLTPLFAAKTVQPINVFGLQFKNRIGVAAGLDKNGDYLDALSALGVGFIEIGAVTPKPQQGNPKPRLFRLTKDQALINRMGFNNKGVEYLVARLKQRKSNCIVGVNLGKNKDTPLMDAANDYIFCLQKVFLYADFCTINISSPNTPELQKLQTAQYLQDLLTKITKARDELAKQHQKKLPLLVKIAPDLLDTDLISLLDIVAARGVDGIIATNTSNQRPQLKTNLLAKEAGGLSGKPVTQMSYDMLVKIRQHNKTLPVISVGGIDSSAEAQRRFQAGAELLQVYTGLIYQGPTLLQELTRFVDNTTD